MKNLVIINNKFILTTGNDPDDYRTLDDSYLQAFNFIESVVRFPATADEIAKHAELIALCLKKGEGDGYTTTFYNLGTMEDTYNTAVERLRKALNGTDDVEIAKSEIAVARIMGQLGMTGKIREYI